jgi:hypothetical protein
MCPSPGDVPKFDTRALPRWSLSFVAALHAAIFAWAGAKLPWGEWSTFGIACFVLALAHLATAIAAAARLSALAFIWRTASVLSLLALGYIGFELARSAAYLAGLYGALGEGIGAGLLAAFGLLAALTLPLAAWGLAVTWRASDRTRAAVAATLALVALGAGAMAEAAHARAAPLPSPGALEAELDAARRELLPSWEALPPASAAVDVGWVRRVPLIYSARPIACAPDPTGGEASAVVTYLGSRGGREGSVSRCVRAAPERLARAVVEQIREEARRGAIKVDVLTGVQPLRSRGPLVDPLALRPGLDGICDAEGCLMPWQLVAGRHFVENQPLPWIPDFRFGVSTARLREALGHEVAAAGAPTHEGLVRLETHSFMFGEDGELIPLVRGRERELELTRARLDHARDLAERHVAEAQRRDGRFRYILDPYTGRQVNAGWSLPRQAGTTLVVCELGRDEERTREVAARSLRFMATHARTSGELIVVAKSGRGPAPIGSTALSAIAFYSCLDHVGDEHDRVLGGMTRSLLAMQRDDGGFHPALDLDARRPIEGPEPLYAAGQVIFALSLAEKLALDAPERAAAAGLPGREVLREAVERAMAHYAGPYWDTFVRELFWLEENWHCLAARASLDHHRNDAYERFCLDYVTFKSRMVLDERSGVAPEFLGGYSLGNILVPVNTPTAGFGEALAAAMSIKRARGEDLRADRARMRRVVAFLARQQWSERSCFACAPNRNVPGGFSESMGAPEIRIDYTQHAWAALGHGGSWIEDELPSG